VREPAPTEPAVFSFSGFADWGRHFLLSILAELRHYAGVRKKEQRRDLFLSVADSSAWLSGVHRSGYHRSEGSDDPLRI
jgi:hypothetical protein